MAKIVTLQQAAEIVAAEVSELRATHGAVFDQAMAYHAGRKLRADIATGVTRDCDGWKSGFVNYDWSDNYTKNPEHIFFDFFRGFILNSVSRINRGLKP